jgi:hypothetical protein
VRLSSTAVVAGFVAGAALVVACGDLFHGTNWETLCDHDASAPRCAVGGGTPSGSTSSSHATSGSGGSGGSGGTSANGGGGSADPCLSYCSKVFPGCMASTPQYETQSNCLNVCEILPHMNVPMADDIPCRAKYAAKVAGNPSLCVEAGPGGGGKCGPICDTYCALMETRCPGEVGSASQCATSCMTYDPSIPYSTAVQTGNNLACRLYWAVQAVDDSMVCVNAGPGSPVCVDADM